MSPIVPISERPVVGGYPTGPGVYFVRAGDSGPIKIGKAVVCISKRIIALQTAHAERLALLAALPCPSHEERLHAQFASVRIRGEWFADCAALSELIRESAWPHQAEPTRRKFTDLAERLRGLRLRLGLTQEQLGAISGLGRVPIVKIETGHNGVSYLKCRQWLARGLGLTLADLSLFIDGQLSIDSAVSLSSLRESEKGAA